jgi:hypothetical protein
MGFNAETQRRRGTSETEVKNSDDLAMSEHMKKRFASWSAVAKASLEAATPL